MIPTKFALEQSHVDFLDQFKTLGFKDKSSIVRLALDKLHQEIERQELEQSAQLYAELYANDEQLQQLTDTAIDNWPI
jgi:Arc/MetJ-type ribon-helix-helix transcriptional regulator